MYSPTLSLSLQQSSLTEKWATSCGKSSASSLTPHDSLFKYVVYKQALSLDRFYIHDVSEKDAAGEFSLPLSLSRSSSDISMFASSACNFLPFTASNLKSAFVLVCLNRFQQIITCHTFQAPNDAVKVSTVSLTHILLPSISVSRKLSDFVPLPLDLYHCPCTRSLSAEQSERVSKWLFYFHTSILATECSTCMTCTVILLID